MKCFGLKVNENSLSLARETLKIRVLMLEGSQFNIPSWEWLETLGNVEMDCIINFPSGLGGRKCYLQFLR